MSYKDKEKQKAAQRESMRKKRETAAKVIESPPEKPIAILEVKGKEKAEIEIGDVSFKSPPPVPELNPPPSQLSLYPGYTEEQIEAARATVKKTLEILEQKGWVLLKCSVLGTAIICIVRDESVKDYPREYPAYKLREIEDSAGLSRHTIETIYKYKVAGLQQGLELEYGG
jgi:hypothetical protein